MAQGSMTKARAKRLQDGLNACLQVKFCSLVKTWNFKSHLETQGP
uniref:Uncharacterized protein n=1 Tax=Cucumis melo TaxID=3656 RepID=A0A9I9EJV1_CUCME